MEETYRQRAKLKLESTDHYSFGLANSYGMLTVAGVLFADWHVVWETRMTGENTSFHIQ